MKARSAWDEVGARKFTIPARSLDLNPIENIFHIAKRRLRQDALDRQITQKILLPFLQESGLHWNQYLLMWWTELSSPWARESNEKDRELNTSFVFTCKYFQIY